MKAIYVVAYFEILGLLLDATYAIPIDCASQGGCLADADCSANNYGDTCDISAVTPTSECGVCVCTSADGTSCSPNVPDACVDSKLGVTGDCVVAAGDVCGTCAFPDNCQLNADYCDVVGNACDNSGTATATAGVCMSDTTNPCNYCASTTVDCASGCLADADCSANGPNTGYYCDFTSSATCGDCLFDECRRHVDFCEDAGADCSTAIGEVGVCMDDAKVAGCFFCAPDLCPNADACAADHDCTQGGVTGYYCEFANVDDTCGLCAYDCSTTLDYCGAVGDLCDNQGTAGECVSDGTNTCNYCEPSSTADCLSFGGCLAEADCVDVDPGTGDSIYGQCILTPPEPCGTCDFAVNSPCAVDQCMHHDECKSISPNYNYCEKSPLDMCGVCAYNACFENSDVCDYAGDFCYTQEVYDLSDNLVSYTEGMCTEDTATGCNVCQELCPDADACSGDYDCVTGYYCEFADPFAIDQCGLCAYDCFSNLDYCDAPGYVCRTSDEYDALFNLVAFGRPGECTEGNSGSGSGCNVCVPSCLNPDIAYCETIGQQCEIIEHDATTGTSAFTVGMCMDDGISTSKCNVCEPLCSGTNECMYDDECLASGDPATNYNYCAFSSTTSPCGVCSYNACFDNHNACHIPGEFCFTWGEYDSSGILVAPEREGECSTEDASGCSYCVPHCAGDFCQQDYECATMGTGNYCDFSSPNAPTSTNCGVCAQDDCRTNVDYCDWIGEACEITSDPSGNYLGTCMANSAGCNVCSYDSCFADPNHCGTGASAGDICYTVDEYDTATGDILSYGSSGTCALDDLDCNVCVARCPLDSQCASDEDCKSSAAGNKCEIATAGAECGVCVTDPCRENPNYCDASDTSDCWTADEFDPATSEFFAYGREGTCTTDTSGCPVCEPLCPADRCLWDWDCGDVTATGSGSSAHYCDVSSTTSSDICGVCASDACRVNHDYCQNVDQPCEIMQYDADGTYFYAGGMCVGDATSGCNYCDTSASETCQGAGGCLSEWDCFNLDGGDVCDLSAVHANTANCGTCITCASAAGTTSCSAYAADACMTYDPDTGNSDYGVCKVALGEVCGTCDFAVVTQCTSADECEDDSDCYTVPAGGVATTGDYCHRQDASDTCGTCVSDCTLHHNHCDAVDAECWAVEYYGTSTVDKRGICTPDTSGSGCNTCEPKCAADFCLESYECEVMGSAYYCDYSSTTNSDSQCGQCALSNPDNSPRTTAADEEPTSTAAEDAGTTEEGDAATTTDFGATPAFECCDSNDDCSADDEEQCMTITGSESDCIKVCQVFLAGGIEPDTPTTTADSADSGPGTNNSNDAFRMPVNVLVATTAVMAVFAAALSSF